MSVNSLRTYSGSINVGNSDLIGWRVMGWVRGGSCGSCTIRDDVWTLAWEDRNGGEISVTTTYQSNKIILNIGGYSFTVPYIRPGSGLWAYSTTTNHGKLRDFFSSRVGQNINFTIYHIN